MIVKKIAFLTSGGDVPGMNALLYALTKSCIQNDTVPFGIFDGFQGFIEGRGMHLDLSYAEEMNNRGGTFIGSARSDSFRTIEGRLKAAAFVQNEKIEGLVVIGGDGTFRGALDFSKETNLPILAIPATIDNDISGTDYTLGFDTALNTICTSIDKIRDTANSHHRVFLIEVMGRSSGNLAYHAALATGAFAYLIPEEQTDLSKLINTIQKSRGNKSKIVIVAEGDDAGSSLDILKKLQPYLESIELRHTVLGHLQRGGAPSYKDRWVASQMGVMAVEFLLQGETNLMLSWSDEILASCRFDKSLDLHQKGKIFINEKYF
jgi:6-phosphofructokinase 1